MTHPGETAGSNTEPLAETEPFDVVSMGETMVAFVAQDDPRRYLATPAGAESNVAVGMARLGCRTRWVSRLGDDPLGRFVETELRERGVDVAVERTSASPTGVLTKHVTDGRSVVQYYRSQSAARSLGPADLGRIGLTRHVHVTGITAAISPSAAQLVEALVARAAGTDATVSFDVNHRPALWPDAATAAKVLLPLARAADVIFVGDDEAETLFGTSVTDTVADLVLQRSDQELVLKRGAAGAAVVTLDGETFEPALAVEVVDVTGAGDAFAAGYLAARLWGRPPVDRLRLGHVMGARVVGVLDDVPPPFEPDELARL